MECSHNQQGAGGIVIPNDLSTVRKARLAIPIQIKVCFFIYPNLQDDVRLVHWTQVVPIKEASIEVALLCGPLPLAGVEIINSPRLSEPER